MTRENLPRGPLARLGVIAVALEAVLLIGYGGYLAVESVIGTATERNGAIVMAVLYVVLGLALGVLARGLYRASPAAMVPTLVWQVLQCTVAIPALQTAPFIGVGLLALSLAAAVGSVAATRATQPSAES